MDSIVASDRPTVVDRMQLTELLEPWRQLRELEWRMDVADVVAHRNGPPAGSARADDAASRPGRVLYFSARNLIGMARDQQGLIEDCVRRWNQVRPHALWPLMRACFEQAVTCIWLLDPEDSLTRQRRALSLMWEELTEQQNKLTAELRYREAEMSAKSKAWPREEKQERRELLSFTRTELKSCASYFEGMRRDAQDLGVAEVDGQPTLPRFIISNEVHLLRSLKVSGEPHATKLYPFIWRQLSGLMHGDVTAAIRSGEVVYGEQVQGGSMATLMLDDAQFKIGLWTITELQRVAMELVLARSTEVDNGPGSHITVDGE